MCWLARCVSFSLALSRQQDLTISARYHVGCFAGSQVHFLEWCHAAVRRRQVSVAGAVKFLAVDAQAGAIDPTDHDRPFCPVRAQPALDSVGFEAGGVKALRHPAQSSIKHALQPENLAAALTTRSLDSKHACCFAVFQQSNTIRAINIPFVVKLRRPTPDVHILCAGGAASSAERGGRLDHRRAVLRGPGPCAGGAWFFIDE